MVVLGFGNINVISIPCAYTVKCIRASFSLPSTLYSNRAQNWVAELLYKRGSKNKKILKNSCQMNDCNDIKPLNVPFGCRKFIG